MIELLKATIVFIINMFRLLNPSLLKSRDIQKRFPETEPYEKGFGLHYKKHLQPKIKPYEEKRLLSLRKARRNVLTGILTGIIILVILFKFPWSFFGSYGSHAHFIFVLVSIVICGVIIWLITKSIDFYRESIKQEIFPNIISFFGEFEYSPFTVRSAREYEYSDLIPSFDNEYNEDEFSGKYEEVKVDFFETELEKEVRTNKGHFSFTVFKGIFITLSMNKNFNGKTIVKKDSGIIGNWFKKSFSKLDHVKLEDPKFEKMFEVFSDDQIEARYLLTVSFMERLKGLAESFEGKSLQCCFYENKLFIMIPVKKNLFEPASIFEVEDFIDDSKSLLKELNLIFNIVDALKLNMKIDF